MTYDFKKLQEIGWFVLVTIVVQLATMLINFDPGAITDWKAWSVALVAGLVRAIAGSVLAVLTKPS